MGLNAMVRIYPPRGRVGLAVVHLRLTRWKNVVESIFWVVVLLGHSYLGITSYELFKIILVSFMTYVVIH